MEAAEAPAAPASIIEAETSEADSRSAMSAAWAVAIRGWARPYRERLVCCSLPLVSAIERDRDRDRGTIQGVTHSHSQAPSLGTRQAEMSESVCCCPLTCGRAGQFPARAAAAAAPRLIASAAGAEVAAHSSMPAARAVGQEPRTAARQAQSASQSIQTAV